MAVIYHCIIIHYYIQKAFYISLCNFSFLYLQMVTFDSITRFSCVGVKTNFTWYHSNTTIIFLGYKRLELKKMDPSQQQVILKPFNWHEWNPIILLILRSKGLHKIAMETQTDPNPAMDESYGLLCLSISPDLLFHVESTTSPNKVWTTLKDLFGNRTPCTDMSWKMNSYH